MTALRQQMENDMVLRGMAVRTRQSYLEAVRSPDAILVEEVQCYLLHLLQERGLSYSTYNLVTNGLRFFYRITLGQSETDSGIGMGKPSHDRHHEPTGTASHPHPAPYNPQGA